ncbi:MAG: rod shape-determining protein [Clostridia bacterium]|nr:rod shape-determining protein [Clostridia bacterium]
MPAISFIGNIAADLGSTNTYILTDEKAAVYSCASAVLVDAKRPTDVYATGDEARHMDGRTGDEALLVSPISFGGIADSELAAILILSAIEKASGKHKPLEKCRLTLSVNEGSTRVERAALVNAAQLAGAKKVFVVKAPVAAAVSMKRHIDKAEAQLIVSIGSNVTEVSVISAGSIVLNRHAKTGSSAFDDAITEYVRRKHGLVIPKGVAMELKRDLGSAVKTDMENVQTLSGRDIRNGRPVTAEINSGEICDALSGPVSALVSTICDALFNIPSEFSNDILRNGICLTGGGSEMYMLAERLKNETGLDVYQSAEPRFDTVRGLMRIASDDRLARQIMSAYSAYEI